MLLACALVLAGLLVSCQEPPEATRPILFIGVDGAEWSVIEALWSEGRMPNLQRLAERGAAATLECVYCGKSPVIWTSIATGVEPESHGVTDFVVTTPEGDVVPVSSASRLRPALWNMLTTASRRVSVLGWYVSWPAEEINGIMVTDRALGRAENRIWPESWLPEFDEMVEEARQQPNPFPPNQRSERDQLVSHLALELQPQRFDLMLTYFKSTDVISHHYWKYFRPEGFEPIEAGEVEALGDFVPQAYEAVDKAIGRLMAAVGAEVNVVVLSDHGFESEIPEKVRITLDFNRVLEHLGFLSHSDGRVDLARTRLFTYSTRRLSKIKKVRFALSGRDPGGAVDPADRERIRRELVEALSAVRYAGGAPVFSVREASQRETRAGADFVVQVRSNSPSEEIFHQDEPIEEAVASIQRISGGHGEGTYGIFVAAGPDIDPEARLEGIHIYDIAPTLLYGLGLPVAEDFAGRAWTELFTPEFRSRHPLETISSWGLRDQQATASNEEDAKLLDELRALGYLE